MQLYIYFKKNKKFPFFILQWELWELWTEKHRYRPIFNIGLESSEYYILVSDIKSKKSLGNGILRANQKKAPNIFCTWIRL